LASGASITVNQRRWCHPRRPPHHSTVITIRGDSSRLREKRRSGLLQKAGTALESEANVKQ
jgi:hypothetical protein